MRLTPVEVLTPGIGVWRADLDLPPGERDALALSLSSDERARAARFHRPLDADRFEAARGLLRGLLGEALGCPPASLRFHYTEHGKPFLEGDGAALGFNLSHCGGVALFALAWDRTVGIDIERVCPDLAAVSLAGRYLPAGEAARLSSLPPADRPAAFTRAWVRHEAFLKALGVGLSSAATPTADARWTCHDLDVGAGYRAALVGQADP